MAMTEIDDDKTFAAMGIAKTIGTVIDCLLRCRINC
jgi:hypothetical protein